jgi:hypothetical protein
MKGAQMEFSTNEKIIVRFYVEPIAKAMVEKRFEPVPTLRGKLINAILDLRPEMKKCTVENLVAEAVGSLTTSAIDQESVEIERLVVAIIARLNTVFK